MLITSSEVSNQSSGTSGIAGCSDLLTGDQSHSELLVLLFHQTVDEYLDDEGILTLLK